MMDFNLILLFVGLGLLGIVILFALWGFLGGLKRELSCIAVFLVLLVLAWLIFGNSGILLNYSGGLVNDLRDILKLPNESNATVWDTILDYLKSIDGLNLDVLLVEGKETYSFVYNVASCIATIILLVVSTLVIVIITPIIRLISHIVMLIIRGVKKSRAKKQAGAENASDETADNAADESNAKDAILVLKGVEGADDAIVTVSENELPAPKKSKKRVWGAIAGTLKGVLLIILLFAPISGIYAVLRSASPETRELISDLVDGNTTKNNVAESNGIADTAFDFVDSYKDSAIGKFVESSSYFFGQSLSTLLFDSMATVKTSTQNIKLRQELVVFIEAVNALEGSIELGSWTDEQLSAALDELKNSKLLPEVMPVGIEYLSEIPALKEALENAMQTTAFLALRDIDWDKDLEVILDTVKEVYKLDVFPLDEFNYLTMDEEVLEKIVDVLGDAQCVNQMLTIAVRTAVKLEAVQKIIGNFNEKLNLEDVNWKEELKNLVGVYATFKEYGYTDISQITDAELNDLVETLIVDNFGITVEIIDQLVDMVIFNVVGIPLAQSALDNYLTDENNQLTDFANIINLKDLTIEDWKADITSILEAAKLAITDLNALSLKLDEMDIESETAVEAMKVIVQKLLSLNLLGDDNIKNELLIALITKFDLFDAKDLFIKSIDGNKEVSIFENVNWNSEEGNIGEIETILNILDIYKVFTKLDPVNMKELKIDFIALLDSEEGVDVLVSVLEELVDSELAISLIDPAVNRYLLPITDKFDDDNLVKDIVDRIPNKEMAEEIIKLVNAIRDAQTLGLFDVVNNNLSYLRYEETEAIINIINTIFESKILKGVEGRVIRIILKATKILDVEKGLLNDINFDGEREVLVNFIHSIENVLKDPNFVLFDEDGKIKLDLDYITQPEIFGQLTDGVRIVLGTFERDENGNFVETMGSKLVEALLPDLVSKYLIDLVPEDFKELVEIIDLENLDGATLASDIRRLTYIASQLVEMDLQRVLVGDPIVYTDKLENIYNVIDALYSVEMLKPCGGEVFAWVINYVTSKFLPKLEMAEVTADDFKDVDWDNEIKVAKELITEMIKFLENNKLESTDDLTKFISEKKYLTTSFVTTENADAIVSILNKALELGTIKAILPIAFEVVVNQLVSSNIIPENFWNDGLTGEMLVEDLYSLTAIADILINDIDIVEAWRDNFEGEIMDIPEVQYVNEIIAILFDMNIVKGYENKLVQFVLEKYLPKNDIVTADSFQVQSINDWANESQAIQDVLTVVFEMLKDNNFETVGQVRDLLNDVKGSTNIVNTLKDYIIDSNISYIAQILDAAANSQLVANILPETLEYGLEKIKDSVIDVTFINDLTVQELQSDVHVLAEIIEILANEGIACVITNNSIAINKKEVNSILETAKAIVGKLNELNLVTKHENELMSALINKGFTLAKLTDFTLSASDLENVDWNQDFASIQQVLTYLQAFAADNDLVIYHDVTEYIKNAQDDIKVVITDVNGRHAVDIIRELVGTGTVKALLPQVVNYAVEMAYKSGYDIRFIKDADLTNDEIANDIVTLTYIIVDLLDLGAINIYNNEVVSNLDENILKDIATQLSKLNILAKYSGDWMAFVVNFALDKLKLKDFNAHYNANNFSGLTSEEWANDTEKLGLVLVDLAKTLDVIFPEGFTINGIKNFIDNKEYTKHELITNPLIDCVVSAISNVLGINVIDCVVTDFINYGVDQLAKVKLFEDIDVQFIKEIVTREVLSHDIINLGEIAKVAIEFGLFEYLDTKNIENINLTLLTQAFDQINELEMLKVSRAEWMTFIANTVMKVLSVKVTYVPADFEEITDEMANNSIETTKVVINELADLLAMWNIESLKEITDFISEKGYTSASYITDEAAILVTNIVKNISNIEPIQLMLPKLSLYGLTKVPEKYDLSFVNPFIEDGTLSGAVIAEDIRTLMDIVVDAVNFGGLDIVYKKYESEPFEIKFEYISSIIEKINLLNTLEVDYNNWVSLISNIGFESLKVVIRVTPEDFAYMSTEAWHEDLTRLASVVDSIAELARNNNLTFYEDIKLFISEKGYTTAQYITDENLYDVLNIVENIVTTNFIEPYLVKGLSALIDNVIIGNSKLPDMKFVSTAIDNKKYTSDLIKADLQTIIEMARNVIDFGAVEILFTKELSEINVSPIQNIIEQINELYMFHLSEAKWFENLFEQVFNALKLDASKYHVDESEYSEMTEADWNQDFANLSQLVGSIGELLEANYITSSKELLEFINNKNYMLAQYVTDENVMRIADMLDTLGSIKALSPALDDFALYGLSKEIKGIDLSFMVEAIDNKELTGTMLSQDLRSLSSIIKDAVELGAINYVFYKEYPALNFDLMTSMFVQVANLNTIAVSIDDWAAFGFNQLFKALKIEDTVDAEQFAMMTAEVWAKDVDTFVEIINKLEVLLELNNITTIDELVTFFKQGNYKLAQYANDDNALALLEILDLVGMVRVIEPTLPILAKFGISKLPTDKIDVSFLLAHLENDLTGEMLSSDIRTLSAMLKEIVEFGTLDYVFYNNIDKIDVSKLSNALAMLDELNIYTIDKAEWLVIGVNQLLQALKVEDRIDVNSFDGIDLDNEINCLINALDEISELLIALNIESTNDLKQFINNKDYLNGQYVTDETLNIVINTIENLQQMQTFRVLLPILAKFGVDQIKGDDLTFLKDAVHADTFTTDELLEDISTVIRIARKAIEFGAFDMIFDIYNESLDGDLAASIVAEVAELNVYNKLRSNWVALGINKLLAVIELNITPEELAVLTEAQWSEDNQLFQNAVIKVVELLNTLDLTYRSAIVNYFTSSDYAELLDNKDLINAVLTNILSTNTVNLIFDRVLHAVVVKAEKSGYDISFVEGKYHATDLINDVYPILVVAENLVDFGIREYIKDKEISSINMNYIANAIAELENMSLNTKFRNEWAKLIVDKVAVAMKLNKDIDYEVINLTDDQWKEDNLVLQQLVLKLGEILQNNNLNKYSEVVQFFKEDKKYALEETYTDDNLVLLSDAIKLVLSFNSVETLFPQVLSIAINKANDFYLDITFLSLNVNIDLVRNDVDTLVAMFKPLCKFGLFELINTKTVKFLNVEYLNEVFALIPTLGIYQVNEEAWAAALVNCIAHKLDADITVSENDFVGINWIEENRLFQEMITKLDILLVESDLVLLENLKEFIKNGYKIQEQYANSLFAGYLVDVIESVSNLASFNVVTLDVVKFALNKLAEKDFDITFLTQNITNNEAVEDVKSLIFAARKTIEFGLVEQLLNKDAIDFSKKEILYEALEKVLNLNMLVGNGNQVIITIFDKLGIDPTRSVGSVEFKDEYNTIVTILDNVINILNNYNIETFEEIKNAANIIGPQLKKIQSTFNDNLASIINILDVICDDNLFKFVVMPLSEKYLSNDKLAGLADLHNIYGDITDLTTDLRSLSEVLVDVHTLGVYDFLIGNKDYPFGETAIYENIINKLFNLNYFNMSGRMDTFVKAIDKVLTGVDLSNVNGNNINLAADASHIVDMMKNITELLSDSEFPIKNRNDVVNKVSVPFSYFFKERIFNLEISAIKHYIDTTLYKETGPIVFILMLPLLKNVLNDYWVALDLDNYTAESINNDSPYLQVILETLVNLDFDAIRNGSMKYSDLSDQVNVVIDNLVELELLDGHYNDLVKLLLRDFVYGKKFGKFEIQDNAFDVDSVDFRNDLVLVKDIFSEFVSLMASEGAITMREASDYIKSLDVKEFADKDEAMNKLANMIEFASQLTMVEFNAKALYEIFGVPALGDNIKYADYREATNGEIYADLCNLPQVIRLAVDMSLAGILKGEVIDYVGSDGMMADYVEQLLTIVGESNYIKYNFEFVLEKLGTKFEGINQYGASYDTLDVQGDLSKVALAYRELAEYFNSSAFPIKSINDLRNLNNIDFKQMIKDSRGYGAQLVSAYEIFANTSIAPYLIPTFVRKVKGFVPTRLQSIINVITTNDLTLEQLAYDTLLSATLLNDIYNSGLYTFVFDKDFMLPESVIVNQIIDDVLDMNMVNTKFIELVEATLVEFNVNMTDVDLSIIDMHVEQEVLKGLVTELLDAMSEYGITSFSQFKSTVKEFISTLQTSKKEFLRKVYHALKDINAEHIVRFVETIAESQLFVETFIPLYNKVLNKYGSKLGSYAQYLTLEGYTKEALAFDIDIVSQSLRTLFDSKFYTVYTQNAELTDEQINLAQDSVRMLGKLNILELKKQAILDVVAKIAKVDLSAIDVALVDVEYDMNILAEALPAFYTICREGNRFHFTLSMLGNTELMNAVIDVLELFFETTTSDAAMPVVVRKLTNKLANVLGVTFSEKTDEQVYNLCDDIITALRALSDMGAFSNNGIDFTNKELTDKVFAVIYNNVNLRSYKNYFDKFVRNIAEYGIINVDYSTVENSEIKTLISIAKESIQYAKNYISALRNKQLSILSDPSFQADTIALANKALTSNLISQVFMPVIVGTTKVATENYGKFAMFEGMSNVQFVKVALPDLFQMATYADTLGLFNKKINLKDVDTIISLAELAATSPATKDSLNELLQFAARIVLHETLDMSVLTNANINYVQEVNILKAVLKGMEPALQNVSLDNVSTLLSAEFLHAFANYGRLAENSGLVKLYIKPIMKKAINKVSSTTDVLNFMLNALNNNAYTNEQAMEDYLLLLNVADQAAYINFFDGSLDYAKLDGHIDILLDNLFALNAVNGNEEEVMSIILSKLTFVETSGIDLSLVSDWDAEFASFTLMCKALATLCADSNFDIENINSSMFENAAVQDKFVEFIDKASKSYVGSEMFKELFVTTVEPNLPVDAQGVIDINALPNEKWAEEFRELFDIYVVLKNGVENTNFSELMLVYDTIFGLNEKDGLEAVKANYGKWLKKIIDSANLPVPSENVRIKTELIPEDNLEALQEVVAIREVLSNLSSYVDADNTLIHDFNYSIVEKSQDYEAVYSTLLVISNSLAMREIILGVTYTTLKDSIDTSGKSAFNLYELLSVDFLKQYYTDRPDYVGYIPSFWNEDELMRIAILVSVINSLKLSKEESLDIYTMELGIAYPDVTKYSNVTSEGTELFPSQIMGPDSVGLRQLLQLLSIIKIFDVSKFGGADGIISLKLKSGEHPVITSPTARPLGEMSNTQEEQLIEINALTYALQVMREEGIIDSPNISDVLYNYSSDTSSRVLLAINESEILRPLLPVLMNDAAVYAVMSLNPSCSKEDAQFIVENTLPEVYEQTNDQNPLSTKEEYCEMIDAYNTFIENSKIA